MDEDEDEQEAATKHTMPSRVPALIFGGRHDGFYAEALGAYHMVAAKKKVRVAVTVAGGGGGRVE